MKTANKDLTRLEKEILRLKRKGLTYLGISRKLNVPESTAYEVCINRGFKDD